MPYPTISLFQSDRTLRNLLIPTLGVFFAGVLCASAALFPAEDMPNDLPPTATPAASDTTATRLPEVTVTALKEAASAQSVPVSVTAVTPETIKDANIQVVKQAAVYAPNVFINEFTARAVSNPYFRGIGAGPKNPGVTTYMDGVPQLNANSSNITLTDVKQIEFVRGPQGALYGRNTLGGLINITSFSPSLSEWTGGQELSYGSYSARELRLNLSGPVVEDQVGVSLAGGYADRNGYTKNTVTGNDLDSRKAWFGKFQAQLKATDNYNARLIFFNEHDRDGDYALGDLNALRNNPFRVNHDYEGYTHRDIFAPTLLQTLTTDTMEITSITGGVWWSTSEATDLDYTALPIATRNNRETDYQLTQEFRIGSLKDTPVVLNDDLKLTWQAGLFEFFQHYDQNVTNRFSFAPANPDQTDSKLKNWGTGLYGQTTLTACDLLDFILGMRYDYEMDKGDSKTTGNSYDLSNDYSSFSPQFGLALHVSPEDMVYGKVTRGYKAGGFNTIAPRGDESYGREKSWCYEVGAKTEWLDGALRANAALFYIDWSDLQLYEPLLASPGSFFIGNAGSASSKGAEFELNLRPEKGWDIFGSLGITDARFGANSYSNGLDVSHHRLPYAPILTNNIGTQKSWELDAHWTLYVRAEMTFYSEFQYDASNRKSQGFYDLADLRIGVRSRNWLTECWVANAFDTDYVPIAIPFASPSGYIGESGAPRTFGVRVGVNF